MTILHRRRYLIHLDLVHNHHVMDSRYVVAEYRVLPVPLFDQYGVSGHVRIGPLRQNAERVRSTRGSWIGKEGISRLWESTSGTRSDE